MIRPLAGSSLAKLTLFPGEPSMRSTLGSLSPTRTRARAEEWKGARDTSRRADGRCRAAANMVAGWRERLRIRVQ